MRQSSRNPSVSTSWEGSEQWYKSLVGEEGHYYHRKIIIPGVLRLMESPDSVLDLACGNGILGRQLPPSVSYVGIDAAPSLITAAIKGANNPTQTYEIGDIKKSFKLKKHDFSLATLILAIQNIEKPEDVFQNVAKHLKKGGKLIIVMNHPCFRIPRQSSWQIDEAKKIQYRRLDGYMHPKKIPIQTHPGKKEQSQTTLSFHHPLTSYVQWLHQAGFAIEILQEWCSDKISTGKAAKMENRSRSEFPLFMAIRAIYLG